MTISSRFDDTEHTTDERTNRSRQLRSSPWPGRTCGSDRDERVLAETAVVEIPTSGHREATRMSVAEVVCVRISLGGEVVEPHL
jgi:hypothetical protein